MTIGRRIKEARTSINISQLELGKRLGVSQSMIAQYENNLRNPKLETLQKIADALGCTVDYLLGDVPEPDGKLVFADEIETPDPKKEDRFDEISCALLGETKNLTEEDKELILSMIKFLAEKRRPQNDPSKD